MPVRRSTTCTASLRVSCSDRGRRLCGSGACALCATPQMPIEAYTPKGRYFCRYFRTGAACAFNVRTSGMTTISPSTGVVLECPCTRCS